MLHYIVEGVLLFISLTLFFNYLKLFKSTAMLAVANDQIIEQADEMIKYIYALEQELQLTKETRDLYWGDRNSLMENIKAMGGSSDDFKTDM